MGDFKLPVGPRSRSANGAPHVLARVRRSRRLLGLLVVLLGLIGLIGLFDWTWFRPLIQHYIEERSGRRIDFDKLQLGLDGNLAPTVRFHNLLVQNAPWASPRPLIRATAFSATFDWASLFHGERTVIVWMKLVDAEIDLEQQADGLRNWRLTRPDDRGPGRIRVLTLEAERSRALYIHRGLPLELHLQTEPLPAPQALPGREGMPLTRTLAVRGKHHAIAFDGAFAVSDVITFFDSNRSFALRGEIGTSNTRMNVQGEASDLYQLGGFDLDLHATGTRLSELAAIFGQQMLQLPVLPTEVSAHANKKGLAWSASRLVARIGRSDLAGSLEYQASDPDASRVSTNPPAQLRATLASRRIDLAQLRAGRGTETAAASTAQPATAVSPVSAQVDWQVGHLDGLPLPVSGLRTHAAWQDERLTLAPLAFVLAGGSASGLLSLAERASSADLRLDGLRLDDLGVRELSGRLNARVVLQSRGASLDAMLAAMSGTAEADLQGASLPAALEAKLGLDGGRWLRTLIMGRNQRTAVRCATVQVRFDKGIGAVQRLALETENVLINGTGSIDLLRRRVKALITPHRKQSALLALDDSIQIDGAFSAPTITLAHRLDDAPRALTCTGGDSGRNSAGAAAKPRARPRGG